MFKTDIIAERAVVDAAPDFAWLALGDTVVLGRAAATQIFAIAGDEAFVHTAQFRDWRQIHDEMNAFYGKRAFEEASRVAMRLAVMTPPAWREVYLELSERFLSLHRSADGADAPLIWTLDSK